MKYRSIFLTKVMTREEAEEKLREIEADLETLRKVATDPEAASNMTISANGGSKSVSLLSPEQRLVQMDILSSDHDALAWRLGLIPSLPGSSIQTIEVTFDK